MGLELYSEIEELFLDKEAADMLWGSFLDIIKELNIKTLLDIGCGGGDFCLMAKNAGIDIKGVDLSSAQVKKAVKKGCNCENINVCEMNEKFESASAIFDVINYMNENELKKFFSCVEKVIEKYFIFDINTFYAMDELAIGNLKAEDENRFATLFSEFKDNKLITEITLFEKKDNNCYIKKQKSITQYYHSVEEIEKLTSMKLKNMVPISLYGSEEAEKMILVFEK